MTLLQRWRDVTYFVLLFLTKDYGFKWTILRRIGTLTTLATSGQLFIPSLSLLIRLLRVVVEERQEDLQRQLRLLVR